MSLSLPTQYLLNRIADVRAGIGAADGWADQDRKDVATEALEHVRRSLRVPELDAELVRRSELDVPALKEGVTSIKEETAKVSPQTLVVKFADGTEYDWKERLSARRLRRSTDASPSRTPIAEGRQA